MNKRRYKGFDYGARDPAPQPEEPEIPTEKAPIRRRTAEKGGHGGQTRQAQEGQEEG